MKRLNYIVILLAGMVASTACSTQTGKDETNTAAPEKERVKVTELSYEEITRTVEYSSTLEAFKVIHLAPSSPGKIETVNVEIGDHVSEGDLLVKMDDAQLVQTRIQFNNLKLEKSRLEELKKTGSIAQQQLDQMDTQFESTKENLDFLAENTVINAPFKGVISGKYFEPGEVYSGAPNTAEGKAAIVSIIKIDKLKAIVSISEEYFPIIKKGMEAKIKVDVYPQKEFTGKITNIYPTIDQMTRTFDVEVSINNQAEELRPGMFCRITLGLQKTNALVLPPLAILKMQGSNTRFLFKENNGKAKRVVVKLGDRFDDKVEVISDELNPGDKIIISGQARLLDGDEITVVR